MPKKKKSSISFFATVISSGHIIRVRKLKLDAL